MDRSTPGGRRCAACIAHLAVAWLLVSSPQLAAASVEALPAPAEPLYAPYLADPRRPNFGFQRMWLAKTEIPESGTERYGVKFGGVFDVLASHPEGRPDRGWRLSLEGGFLAQFDRAHADDAIGWDGIYGGLATFRSSEVVAYKLGLHHVSAHVGDEYAERTGRRRIDYTRGELVAGVRWSASRRWDTYGEAGWAYDLRNEELQAPWRAQLGIEYRVPRSHSHEWYFAADAYASEERDWRIDGTLQAGVAFHRGERTWRFGLEHYRGRSLLGEFFQHDERYTSLGVWLDL